MASLAGAVDGFVDPSTSSTVVAAGGSKTVPETMHLDGLANPPQADIVIAMDSTNSMDAAMSGGATAPARVDAKAFIDQFAGKDVRFSVRRLLDDPAFDGTPAGTQPYQQILPFSDNDAQAAKDAIDNQTPFGPGAAANTPELHEAHFGLFNSVASQEDWRPDAQKWLVVFSDQVGHDSNTNYFSATGNEFCTFGTDDAQTDHGGVAGSTGALQAAGVKADFVNYVTLYGSTMQSCQASISRLTGGHGAYSEGQGANAGKAIAGAMNPNRVLSDFFVNIEAVSWPGGTDDHTNDPVFHEWIDTQNVPANPVSVPPGGTTVPFNVVINPPPGAAQGNYAVDVVASWNDGTTRVRQRLNFTVGTPLTSIALTVDQATVPAGVKKAPLGSIPPDRLALASGSGSFDSTPIGSTPIASTPIASTPIASTPIASTPIASTPIASTGLLSSPIASTPIASTPIASTPLEHVLLSQINLVGKTWDDVLCAPLKGQPLQVLTLADVKNNACSKANFEALTLGQVDLSSTLLRGVRWSSLLFGNVTFGQLPGGLAAYTGPITNGGGTPAQLLSTDTPLGADIAGVLGQTPSIGSTPIASTPIASTPIASTPIASTHVTSSRLAQVKVGKMSPNPGEVVDCGRVDCTAGTTATLGTAAALNAIIGTFGAPSLKPALDDAGITMNDIVTALLAASDFPWEHLPVQGLQSVAGTGQNATYHLTVGVDCSVTGDNSFDAVVDLPNGFYPVPGTSTLSFGGGAAVPTDDPEDLRTVVIEGPRLNDYRWGITCPSGAEGTTTVVLTFQSFAGLTLGEQTSSAQATLNGFTIRTGPDKAPITVTENWETNEDASVAPQIAPDELEVGHIGSTGDQDFFRLPLSGLPRGTRVSVYLSHVPNGADFDLTVGKPSAQGFFSTPIASTPIASTPIEDFGVTVDNQGVALPSEALQDIAVGSTPIASTPIASTSTTRGSADEQAGFITQGESGFATIGVTGYNGSSSNSPYVLRVKETPPPVLPSNCPAPAFMGGNPSSIAPGSLPSSVPTTAKTLFIMNKQRLTALYGTTTVNNLVTSLNTLALRTEVAGTVLNVDGNAAVRNAYAAWDNARCSIDAANNVVRSINDVIQGYRAQNGLPNVKFIVLVGGDDALPSFRTPDPVLLSPELNEASDLAYQTAGLTKGNPLYASAATNNILGDGAYGTLTAIPWLGHDLMLPQLSVGRLVENATDMKGQIDQYIAQNGVVSTTTGGLVTGYDFLADGAGAVKTNVSSTYQISVDTIGTAGNKAIQPLVVPPAPQTVPPWTSTDAKTGFLQNANAAALAALNAHYNHYELEAADGSLASTADATASTLGRILFTMGCHGGLNIPDATDPLKDKDWAQVWGSKKVAMYLANTGFGYGDSASIALSERLMALFAQNLHTNGLTVGEQWVNALHQYFATAGAYDVYDEKVMAETTFYGLPFWKFSSNGPTTIPAPLSTTTDSVTGAQIATVNFPASTGVDTHTQFGLYRPNLQIRSQEVTSNAPARGLWINALSTTDLATGPTIGYPTVDLSQHEPAPNIAPIFFPASPFTLEHSTAFGKSRDFVNVSDQFRPGSPLPTRHVNSAQFKVLYSYSSDASPPLISQVDVTRDTTGSTVVTARMNDDQGIDDAAALVYTATSAWTYVPLHVSSGDPSLYVSNPFNTTVEPEVFVESTDGTNVSYSANKGRNFTTNTSGQVPGPRILIAAPFGQYTQGQAVNASFQCLPNTDPVTSCDGSVPTGQAIDTSTPGVHTFVVRAEDQSGDNTALTRTYFVQFPFKGFFQPVDNEPIVNTVNAGRAIPVKFSLGGNRGLDIFAPGYPKSQAVGCDTEDPVSPIDSTVTAGQSSLSYDAGNDQYNYVWKTDDGWANTCRILVVKLRDGSSHEAKFKFKK